MRLKQAHIYGFGRWIDYTIEFSSHSFICVLGENESGKSTIQKFILFMLFGLPPRKREFFRPKQSGKMGGRLTIDDSSFGIYTIERMDEVQNGAARCYINGNEYGEDWLKQRLKGLTKEIYNSIYSFSALDLINISEMKDEDLGDVLLGIGLTGASNIYSIEKSLEQKTGELFKPYGKKPLINEQLTKVDGLHKDLHKLKENELTYQKKHSQLELLKDQLKQLQNKLETTKKNLLIIEKQQHTLHLIHDYQIQMKELNNFPQLIIFPENGIERLELLKDQLLPYKSEYAILQNNLQKNIKVNEKLKKELIDESIYKEAEEIYHKKQQYIEKQNQMDHLQQTINELEFQMNTTLKELNIDIDQTQLQNITFPFHTEQIWNELKNKYESMVLEKERLDEDQYLLKKQQSFLETEQKKFEDLRLDADYINELQRKISDYSSQKDMKKMSIYTKQQYENWEKKKKKNNYILIVSIIASALIVGIGFTFNFPFLYNFSIFTLVIGMSQWFFGRNSMKEMKRMIMIAQQSKPLYSNISEEEKHKTEQLLSSQEVLKADLTSVEEQLKLIDIQFIKWNEKYHLMNQQEGRLRKQIEEQYEKYSFLKSIDIKYWPEVFHSLKNLISQWNEQQNLMEQYHQLSENLLMIQQKIHRLLRRLNVNYNQKPPLELFEIIHEILRMNSNKQIEIEQNNKQISDYREQRKELVEKIKTYEREISNLFSIAEVKNEENFYEKANKVKNKLTLELKMERLKEQLSYTFPEAEWKKMVRSTMTETDLDLLEQKNTLEIENLDDQIDHLRQQLAHLNANLLNMESSESYSLAMHQFYMEKEQLRKLALDWAVVKTAKEMLEVTKKNYREKHLTKVVEKTSEYFQRITDGAYRKVYAPRNKQSFQVESVDGLLYNVNELSRGTIDQLYVSLRIAISEIMNIKHHLPFIIDDAFLNFDSIRSKRMMDILKDLSTHQQIILFTCHQSLFDDHESVPTIDLNNLTRIHEA